MATGLDVAHSQRFASIAAFTLVPVVAHLIVVVHKPISVVLAGESDDGGDNFHERLIVAHSLANWEHFHNCCSPWPSENAKNAAHHARLRT